MDKIFKVRPVFVALCLVLTLTSYSQNYQSATQIGGVQNDILLSTRLDGDNNVYMICFIAGIFSYTIDGNTFTLGEAGITNRYFAKYANSGDLIWIKPVAEDVISDVRGIDVDNQGNIYLTGAFTGTLNFGLGNTLVSNGGKDIFFAKYNNDGDLLWVEHIGGNSKDEPYALSLDSNNDLVIAGSFSTSVDFNPVGGATLVSEGNTEIFFAKYDQDGNFVFAKQAKGNSNDEAFAIRLDQADNIYLTGYTLGSGIDFDTNTAGIQPGGFFGSNDNIFIAKYDKDGNYEWAMVFGSNQGERGEDIAIDSEQNVYLTGDFRNTIDFDFGTGISNLTSQGNRDIFLAKYDKDANLQWAKSFGSTDNDRGKSVTVDKDDEVYLAAVFRGSVDFGSGPLASIASSTDIALVKFDPEGNLVWINQIGSSDGETSQDLVCDNQKSIYISGSFRNTLDFNPDPIVVNELTSNGSQDAFWAKYVIIPSPLNLEATAMSSSEIKLTWEDTKGEMNYTLERRAEGEASFTAIATLEEDIIEYIDQDLVTGREYCYRVRGMNDDNIQSDYSNIACATTMLEAPQAPVGLEARSTVENTIVLKWEDNSTEEDGFILERSIEGESDFTELSILDANLLSYVDTDVEINQTYCYRIKAFNTIGESAYSNTDCEKVILYQVLLPNTFTPNGDGKNDRLILRSIGIETVDFKIFNRRGDIIYQTKDVAEITSPTRGWSGDRQPNGLYFWTIKVGFTNKIQISEKGKVNLIR